MSDRAISSALSADLIELLIKRDMSVTQIAALIGVTKSFISRVRSRSRSLTIDHLVALEAAVGEPLPLLLLEATPLSSVPASLRPLYKSTRKVLSSERARRKTTSSPRRKVA